MYENERIKKLRASKANGRKCKNVEEICMWESRE
jgi:hypothetical protein